MSFRIDGEEYYWTAEACKIAGISKNTFLRWLRNGTFNDVETRDRRGWRLFTASDVEKLEAEAQKIRKVSYIMS